MKRNENKLKICLQGRGDLKPKSHENCDLMEHDCSHVIYMECQFLGMRMSWKTRHRVLLLLNASLLTPRGKGAADVGALLWN